MSFSPQIREDVLVACGRHCCLCHNFCGPKIELHHILPTGDGGHDTFENCIPLCFNCHADMTSYDHRHPKGSKYTPSELKRHRDTWFVKIENNPGPLPKQESVELDQAMYRRLRQLLQWDSIIYRVRSGYFISSSFERAERFPLEDFLNLSEDPAFEFIDPDIEGLRVKLSKAIEEFLDALAANTYRTDTLGMFSIPDEWEYENPVRYEEAINKIKETSFRVGESYDALVKLSRRKLGAE